MTGFFFAGGPGIRRDRILFRVRAPGTDVTGYFWSLKMNPVTSQNKSCHVLRPGLQEPAGFPLGNPMVRVHTPWDHQVIDHRGRTERSPYFLDNPVRMELRFIRLGMWPSVK